MIAFLIITSSSLVFYVALLVALHRDGRKRRIASEAVRKISLGTVAELGTPSSMANASIAGRRHNSSAILVHFAETRRREKLKSQAVVSESAEVITLPEFAQGKNNLQCG